LWQSHNFFLEGSQRFFSGLINAENIKQIIIDSLKDIEWDVMQGKTDAVMTKLEEAQKLTREWIARKT
jgi:hypothetical protein